MKAKVIKFSWEGKGTIPTVLMHWHNQKVKFEVPLAMMFAYQELEKEVKELKEHLQVKKLADSPIIAMIDNKPVHQDEYEALKKELKEALNIIKDF